MRLDECIGLPVLATIIFIFIVLKAAVPGSTGRRVTRSARGSPFVSSRSATHSFWSMIQPVWTGDRSGISRQYERSTINPIRHSEPSLAGSPFLSASSRHSFAGRRRLSR